MGFWRKWSKLDTVPSKIGPFRQSFENKRDCPVYISVEMTPECFELEPGETLTLVWSGPDAGQTVQVEFLAPDELNVWPEGNWFEIEYLIDGEPADQRSWAFKHR